MRYYRNYIDIATRAGAGLQLETPTWRASGDWGDRLGYSAAELRRVNRDAVALLDRSGMSPGSSRCSSAAASARAGTATWPAMSSIRTRRPRTTRHRSRRFAEAGADLVTVLTLTGTGEAIGSSAPHVAAGLPVAVSFTVEQDGRLPDGTPLSEAVTEVDAEAAPDYFMVNCAHPTTFAPALTDGRRLALPHRRTPRERVGPQP